MIILKIAETENHIEQPQRQRVLNHTFEENESC